MADKFRRTYPLKITFGAGEQPTSQKLTAMSEQTRNGLAVIEKTIGDIWNQSGDSIYEDLPLYIPNFGRAMGSMAYLNPAIYPMQEFRFREQLGERWEKLTEGHLLFKPKTGNSTWNIYNDGTSVFNIRKTNERDVDAPGDYWIDDATGRFRTFSPINDTIEVEYDVDPPTDWHTQEDTVPSVIPDPGQQDFNYVRVSESNGLYFIHLPPRRPLTLGANERPAAYPAASEIANNQASSSGGTLRYWQYDGDALTDEHYRYMLPKEIIDGWDADDVAAGQDFPTGTMYLWDDTEKTIIEDVIFTRPLSGDKHYILQVSSNSYDFAGVVTTTEDLASYQNSKLILVTCGVPATRALWSLATSYLRHRHDNTGTHEPPIKHDSLQNTNPPTYEWDDHSGYYPTHLPAWAPSNYAFDVHTSLLSRVGSQSSATYKRDPNNNAMLGHLVLATTVDQGDGIFVDATPSDETYRLYFGDVGGPSLYVTDTDTIRFRNQSDVEMVKITNNGLYVGNGDGTVDGILNLRPCSSSNEGGEIILQGYDTFVDWRFDSYQDRLRWFVSGEGEGASLYRIAEGDYKFVVGPGGNSASITIDPSSVTSGYNAWLSTDNTSLKLGHSSGSRNLEFQLNSTTVAELAVAGNLYLTAASALGDSGRFITALDNAQPTSQWRNINFGRTDTNGNCAELCFYYAGDDNASNCLTLGLHSIKPLYIYNDGHCAFTGYLNVAGQLNAQADVVVTGDLYVNGNAIDLAGTAPTMLFDDTDHGHKYWWHNNSGLMYLLWNEGSGDVWVSPHPVYFSGRSAYFDGGQLTVDGVNDRVGIGTSSPGVKLDVQAGAAQGVKIVSGQPCLNLQCSANDPIYFTKTGGNVETHTFNDQSNVGFRFYQGAGGVGETFRVTNLGKMEVKNQIYFSTHYGHGSYMHATNHACVFFGRSTSGSQCALAWFDMDYAEPYFTIDLKSTRRYQFERAKMKIGQENSNIQSYLEIHNGFGSTINWTMPGGNPGDGACRLFCVNYSGWPYYSDCHTEMVVEDGDGNTSVISPHNSKGEWIFRDSSKKYCRQRYIHMEKLVWRLEELLGESFTDYCETNENGEAIQETTISGIIGGLAKFIDVEKEGLQGLTQADVDAYYEVSGVEE